MSHDNPFAPPTGSVPVVGNNPDPAPATDRAQAVRDRFFAAPEQPNG
jgi:hypothetical protein